jgi:5'-nucleotidase
MEEFHKINRRTFLRYGYTLAATSALGQVPLVAEAYDQRKSSITILHTNDWHSRIEPFPKNDKNFPDMGGAERRAAYIQQVRTKTEHVLLLDSGDVFQGTPYFNFYGGELEFKLMTQMGYDCATLGNHEFDNGIEGFAKQLPHAGFDFVNCNYDFSKTILKDRIQPYKIIQKGKMKIGILGVGIELQGLVPDAHWAGIRYLDPIQQANSTAELLHKKHGCDLIVCLSHLGYRYDNEKPSDRTLAVRSKYIDLILGGHTHTFMPAPEKHYNLSGQPVLINQMGWGGVQMGRIDVNWDTGKALSFRNSVQTIG